MDQKITVLVTGASGFIGKHICEKLIEQGYTVRGLVRSKNGLGTHCTSVKYFAGDILDSNSLIRACSGAHAVVHAAGLAHVNNVDKHSLKRINVHGTKLLVEAASQSSVRRLILISSVLAGKANDERDKYTKYAEAKRDAEKIVLSAHKTGQLDAVILRPANVYGPGMRGNIAFFMSLIKKGLSLRLPESDSKVSLVGVRDLSDAIILSIEAGQAAGRTYVVTDGLEYGINQVEAEIYRTAEREIPTLKVPGLILYFGFLVIEFINKGFSVFNFRLPIIGGLSRRTYHSLFRDNLHDNSAIRNELGFSPRTTLYDSLEEIIHNLEN